MQEYIRTLIYVSLFSIVIEVIIPETKLKKHISTMIALVIVFVTISPVVEFVKSEDILSTISRAYENVDINMDVKAKENVAYTDMSLYINEQIKSDVKRKMELEILNKYNDKGYLVNRVEVDLNNEYLVDEVNIYVSDINTVDDAKRMIKDVTDEYKLKNSKINIINGE